MYYYNNEMPPQQGWICPKCGRVNAPWLPTCDCVSSQTRATFDTTSLTDRKTEPQTDGYMTAEQAEDYRKMLDKAEHKVYGNIEDEPQSEKCPFDDSLPCEWVCTEYGKCKYKPQTEREGE